MSSQKKFGAFAGVFTPSLLTILGVIMYMRLGWVVGNAGLIGAIAIIVVAHIISITTGLSISSIATDKKVGPGGVYYVLSRSLGLPIGGAIGITLFVGTAMSIALYLIGFAESFLPYFGLASDINGLRIGGTLALAALSILALISTSLALKAQFFILAAIILSLVSIFFGVSPQLPETISYAIPAEGVSMEAIFAVFFPAVTGFTAGIAMSGDLQDPKKSIPSGTLWSIGVGFVVYIGLAVFIFSTVDGELLRTDNNIMLKIAYFAPAVVAGIWGATLSSALGGILGGPRIMQAMSVDKITPKFFAKGVGRGNDPRNALILTVIIAEAGILIGELDTIARVCSMFYLAAYGFINLSFYLESWASADFKPTFKVKKWIGFVGFIATFVVMFRLDMVAMVGAFIVIGGIYLWLTKKELNLGSGDIWQSVWSSVVKTGLRKMDDKQDHKRNWKPNVLLFSGGTDHRPHLLEFSKDLVGNRGIVTNFDLHENQEAKVLFPKHQQSVNDEILKKYGVFGRKLEVKNVFQGIESIASTFGFSGIEPNTILMGWAKNTSDPVWFAQMTHKLMDLDYNILYLDYDNRYGFRKHSEIDLWWRGEESSAELMLNISKFLLSSELWRNAQIRILLVDNTNTTKKVIERKIERILEEHRLSAAIKIIGNAIEKRPLYELMKMYSSEADLILVGIPEVELNNPKSYVTDTNDLVRTIGTTLLVKASAQFDQIQFFNPTASAENISPKPPIVATEKLVISLSSEGKLRDEINRIQQGIEDAYHTLAINAFKPIEEKYSAFFAYLQSELNTIPDGPVAHRDGYNYFLQFFKQAANKLDSIRKVELSILGELLQEENQNCQLKLEELFKRLPKKTTTASGKKVPLKKIALALQAQQLRKEQLNVFNSFGNQNFECLTGLINEIGAKIYHLFDFEDFADEPSTFKIDLDQTLLDIKQQCADKASYFQHLNANILQQLTTIAQRFILDLDTACTNGTYTELLKPTTKGIRKAANVEQEQLQAFPANWTKNQNLIHSTLVTDLALSQLQGLINRRIKDITDTLAIEVNKPVEKHFEQHAVSIERLRKQYEKKAEVSLAKLEMDEHTFPDIDKLTQDVVNDTVAFHPVINQDVDLISQALTDDFLGQQHEDHQTVSLDLLKIVDFILDSKLHGPLQSHLEQYLTEVTNLYYNETNRYDLLKYALSESGKQGEIKQLLAKVEQSLNQEKKLLAAIKIRFIERIRTILYDLHMELNSRYLVNNSTNWSRFISVSNRKKGFAKASEYIYSRYAELYDTIQYTLTAKKQESIVSTFEANHDLKSDVELGRSFIEQLLPNSAVDQQLPFYYKQLFWGKHIPIKGAYKGRVELANQIRLAIKEKGGSVILIAGNSGSGKSHLAGYLAEQSSASVIKIESKTTRGGLRSLNNAFRQATKNKHNAEQAIINLPRQSTIVIDDIEVWWDRTVPQDPLYHLLSLIALHGKNNTFLLTSNLYALEALKHNTILQQVVTHTFSLPPVAKEAVKEIILERHKMGGMNLSYKLELNNYRSKQLNSYFSALHETNEGNIGLALQNWVGNINTVKDNTLMVSDLNPAPYLKVSNPNWKWILYQIILNNNLTNDNIKKLFGEEADFVTERIYDIIKAGIIEKSGGGCYTIKSNVKASIEKWLKEVGVF